MYSHFTLEEFNYWIFCMDEKLRDFIQSLPLQVSSHLNYSISSLVVLEKWFLKRYGDNPEKFQMLQQAIIVDGGCRYIGETFRKQIGGHWDVDLAESDEEKKLIPFIIGFKGKKRFYPYIELKKAVYFKTGTYVIEVVRQLQHLSDE